MRFVRKTDYDIDVRLFRYSDTVFWYSMLAILLLATPFFVEEYLVSQAVFVGIYVIVGAGVMLLSGYCGQISLGHAAFFALGAYSVAIAEKAGVPFPLALVAAALVSAFVGAFVGLAAVRLSGIYLAIATLAFAFIVEEILHRWESLTRGSSGMLLDPIAFGSYEMESDIEFYYLVLGLVILIILGLKNIIRTSAGLAMMAVRDSETAAQSVGIDVARTKLTAFLLSAGLAGIAGALYAHKILFISPEQFNVFLSIEFVVLIFIGGIGSIHGIIFGSIFIIVLPQAISILKDNLPASIADVPNIQSTAYGLILFAFILFEPDGIYGIWLKIKHYFSWFPLYKKGELSRQKTYSKSESW